jgi:protease-4
VTGSIGVIFAGLNLSGLLEKLGVANQTLTAGDFKDAGSPLRPMRAEERAWLEGVLDDLFERFVAVVDEGRPDLTRSEVEALADGRIFSASQALEAGLVDALGDLPAAVEEARTRAGLEEARVVVYHRPNERAENLFSMAPAAPEPESALPLPPGLSQPAFLYLWWPGGP